MAKAEKKIILVVEDNPADVELTRIAFERQNLPGDMIVAWDGIEAIEYLFRKNGNEHAVMPCCILLDLKLPRMDGFSVLKQIRGNDKTKHIPVIVVTTSNDEETIEQIYRLGANSCINKSPRFIEFSRMLSAAVRQATEEDVRETACT